MFLCTRWRKWKKMLPKHGKKGERESENKELNTKSNKCIISCFESFNVVKILRHINLFCFPTWYASLFDKSAKYEAKQCKKEPSHTHIEFIGKMYILLCNVYIVSVILFWTFISYSLSPSPFSIYHLLIHLFSYFVHFLKRSCARMDLVHGLAILLCSLPLFAESLFSCTFYNWQAFEGLRLHDYGWYDTFFPLSKWAKKKRQQLGDRNVA